MEGVRALGEQVAGLQRMSTVECKVSKVGVSGQGLNLARERWGE